MALVDERPPVSIRGIKESTLALQPGQKPEKVIENLKAAGATVTQEKNSSDTKDIEEQIAKVKSEIQDLRPGEQTKTKGLINVEAKDNGSPVSAPAGRQVTSNGPVDFELVSSLNLSSGELKKDIEVIAKEPGNNVESFNDITNILAIEGQLASVTPLNTTQDGQDPNPSDTLKEEELKTLERRLEDLQEQQQKQEEDVGQLKDLGVLGEGVFTVILSNNQPNIGVATSNRYVEHETVDGAIIRQKVGQGNKEITMEGLCTTPEANLIDNLPNENRVFINSNRFRGNVTIDTTSTSPIEDGGGMDLDGNFTHEFDITLVQVEAR